MHEVLVNRLGGLSLPRKSVVRLTDRPDMTLDVYRGRKTTKQQHFSESTLVCYWWIYSPSASQAMGQLTPVSVSDAGIKVTSSNHGYMTRLTCVPFYG